MNKAKAGQVVVDYLENDMEILQDGWKVTDGWGSSQPMAEWYGVTTNAEGRVIGLNLDSNDLAGKRRYDAIDIRAGPTTLQVASPQRVLIAVLNKTSFWRRGT